MNRIDIKIDEYSSADLVTLKKEIERVLKSRQMHEEAEEVKKLNINGITSKDIAVKYFLDEEDHNDDLPNNNKHIYSFNIKYEGKLYDIYFDHHKQRVPHTWWPWVESDLCRNGAYAFVPSKFHESSENCYECTLTHEEAVELLNDFGITDITPLEGTAMSDFADFKN